VIVAKVYFDKGIGEFVCWEDGSHSDRLDKCLAQVSESFDYCLVFLDNGTEDGVEFSVTFIKD
jgi:hypothetical protein